MIERKKVKCEVCGEMIYNLSDHKNGDCLPLREKAFKEWRDFKGEVEYEDIERDEQISEGEPIDFKWYKERLLEITTNSEMNYWITEKLSNGKRYKIALLVYDIYEIVD